MKHKLSLFHSWAIWLLTFWLPDIPLIMRFRGFLYSPFMDSCGKNFQVSASTRIIGLPNMSVGRDVFLAANVVVNCGAEIRLDDEVLIGIGAVLVSGNHTCFSGSYRFGKPERKSITIGYGSWIGANTTVIAGASLPKSSLLAANSVLNKRLQIEGVYGGVPVKLIKANSNDS